MIRQESANLHILTAMAYYATKRFNYWGQLGILMAFTGAGLIIGAIVSLLPLLGKLDLGSLKGGQQLIDKIMVPENANAIRWMQFLSTLCIFFLPAFVYAKICHKKPVVHLGFNHSVQLKQAALVLVIMLACLPVVGALGELSEMLPVSAQTMQQFKNTEAEFEKQVAILGRINGFADYIFSLIVLAFLPAVFEETFFRGCVQNLLSRWWKSPVLAIIITSVIFSAVHGSYLGFASRAFLGFILGWLYYRTNNIWLNIIAHFINNGFIITAMYIVSLQGKKTNAADIDGHYPWWLAVVAAALLYGLFKWSEKINAKDIDRPGQEVAISYEDIHNPVWHNNPFNNPTQQP